MVELYFKNLYLSSVISKPHSTWNEQGKTCRLCDLLDWTLQKWNQNLVRYPEAVTQKCSVNKVFLKMSQNSQENTFVRASFLIKLLVKKETLAHVFSSEFCEFLTLFSQSNSERLNHYSRISSVSERLERWFWIPKMDLFGKIYFSCLTRRLFKKARSSHQEVFCKNFTKFRRYL